MMPIVILTATYNHPKELENLYHTLTNQNDNSFTWIIINDGSKEDTVNLIDRFQREALIDIKAYHQENGGKSKAINQGIELLKTDAEFFLIVDDDEKLDKNAVQLIKDYYSKYKDTDCGVIHFNRRDENGNVIADPYFEEDYFMPFQVHKGKGYHADGYLGYFTEKLGDNRFRIYDGEKYISPSTLFMTVTRKSQLLWASPVLGETKYLDGGITKQGRRLRIKNPQGMIDYCKLMQGNGATLKTRISYSIQGFAYLSFCQDRRAVDMSGLLKTMYLPGIVLGKAWKKKYGINAK